jgi:hypothetical protein
MAVCTIATAGAVQDLKVFLKTLELFNTSPPTVYLLCDDALINQLPKYKGTLKTQTKLNRYAGLNRLAMSRLPGIEYKSLWEDFMMEKATVMAWAFQAGETRLFFCDCDICFMGPLPDVPPDATLGVCPHRIRQQDEQKFGKYNAGFVYTTDPATPAAWRKAALTSRYYDQAALEDLVAEPNAKVYEFPTQTNYGWWRMFQADQPPAALQAEWSIFRSPNTAGIRVSGEQLLSIHTHWGEKIDRVTLAFNLWVFTYLARLGSHTQPFVHFLAREFPHLKIPKN